MTNIACNWLETHESQVGEWVQPDKWRWGNQLQPGDGPAGSWPGCQFRLRTSTVNPGWLLAVKVTVTGKPHYMNTVAGLRRYRSRVRIEFAGDCEPSVFSGGWIYHILSNQTKW
jgi:hypothetical protein